MKNPPASIAHLDFVAGIPTLDLSDFVSGSEQQRAQFVNELGAVYREVGLPPSLAMAYNKRSSTRCTTKPNRSSPCLPT